LAREAQGSFGNTMLPKPSCRAHGFGYFRRNENSSLAAEASETYGKRFALAKVKMDPGFRRDDEQRKRFFRSRFDKLSANGLAYGRL